MERRMSIDQAIDTELGEVLQEDEEQLTQQIARHIVAKMKVPPSLRDAHPKAHGCVHAVFQVESKLESDLAQGVFVPGQSYKAWIRFSNGNKDHTRPDAKGDARGMAIKLLGVPGEKILQNEKDAQTQDFVMINHPVFFIDDVARYLDLMREEDAIEEDKEKFEKLFNGRGGSDIQTVLRAGISDLRAVAKTLGVEGGVNLLKMASSKIASPLETVYWSMVPYRLGDTPHKHKIKFRAKPRLSNQAAPKPVNPSPNFLRETMIRQLAAGAGPRQFDFEIQRGTASMSVENSRKEWDEAVASFAKVATITIPEQDFTKYDKFGEDLSFTPWHALPQHRPLGAVNRVRRVVYEAVSTKRHELNASPRHEPSSLDPEVGAV
jgi:hypothetical protein